MENKKITLVLLWVTVLFNMIFADIFSFMVEIVKGNVIEIPGNVEIIMALAAIITNIPILMVVLSWVLPYGINKTVNITAAVFTIVYIIAGGVLLPHYVVIASVEVILLLIIVYIALKWKIYYNKEL